MFRARSRFTPPGRFDGEPDSELRQVNEFANPAIRYAPPINPSGGQPPTGQSLYGPLAQLQQRLVGVQDTQRTATFGK